MQKELLKNLLKEQVCMFCKHGQLDLLPVSSEDEAKLNNWHCFTTVSTDVGTTWCPGAMYRQALRCHHPMLNYIHQSAAREVKRQHTCSSWEPRKESG